VKLLVALLVVVLTGGGFALYRARLRAVERSGWTALFQVARPGSRGDGVEAGLAQSFLEVAAAHPGTAAGIQARLFAAKALFDQGKYSDARTQFESFLQQNPDTELAGVAALGIAVSLDSEGKTNEALASYQNVAAQHPNSPVFIQARLAIARIHESRNEPGQALKIYDELSRSAARNAWGAEAAMLREHLLLAHPELAATNQPASVSATATNIVRIVSTNAAPADQ